MSIPVKLSTFASAFGDTAREQLQSNSPYITAGAAGAGTALVRCFTPLTDLTANTPVITDTMSYFGQQFGNATGGASITAATVFFIGHIVVKAGRAGIKAVRKPLGENGLIG